MRGCSRGPSGPCPRSDLRWRSPAAVARRDRVTPRTRRQPRTSGFWADSKPMPPRSATWPTTRRHIPASRPIRARASGTSVGAGVEDTASFEDAQRRNIRPGLPGQRRLRVRHTNSRVAQNASHEFVHVVSLAANGASPTTPAGRGYARETVSSSVRPHSTTYGPAGIQPSRNSTPTSTAGRLTRWATSWASSSPRRGKTAWRSVRDQRGRARHLGIPVSEFETCWVPSRVRNTAHREIRRARYRLSALAVALFRPRPQPADEALGHNWALNRVFRRRFRPICRIREHEAGSWMSRGRHRRSPSARASECGS